MKWTAALLALATLAACETTSTITRTGETVSFGEKTYDIYVENIRTWGEGYDYRYARRMIGTETRYIWCEGDCQARLDALLGP